MKSTNLFKRIITLSLSAIMLSAVSPAPEWNTPVYAGEQDNVQPEASAGSSEPAEESSDGSEEESVSVGTTEAEPQTTEETVQEESPSITTESKDVGSMAGNTLDLEVLPEKAPVTDANKLSAYVTWGNNKVELDEAGSATASNVGWMTQMNLHIDAEFGAGKDKKIEITLPEGMTYHVNYNSVYKVNHSDVTLKQLIKPTEQEDSAKRNRPVQGVDQANGTMTLLFNSEGDENDAKSVSFDVPIGPAALSQWNSEVWESGLSWYYDDITDPVTVTQSMGGNVSNTLKLGRVTVQNDEGKAYGTSWKAKYNPEVLVNESTTGNDTFWAKPIPGGGTYPRTVGFKYYSVTFTAPEHAEFKKLNPSYGTYNNVEYVVTEPGNRTEFGYEVPEGYKAYTWTVRNAVMGQSQMVVAPVFYFPKKYFSDEDLATIKIADMHVRYYGRDYADGKEEDFDASKYPSLTYKIRGEYEEVFANTYQTNDIDKNGNRNTEFYEADGGYTLYMGAPGFEHSQERRAGYFYIGNRGLRDSAPKVITFEFDDKNTGAIGITQAEIPSPKEQKRFHVSDVEYKIWDSRTGEVTDWQRYTGTEAVINLKDLGIQGDSGKYIKTIRLHIDTIPKQAYLKNGQQEGRQDQVSYPFFCNVLTEKKYVNQNWGEIENRMTISNENVAEVKDGSDLTVTTDRRPVTGRAYDGTTGESLIIGNNLAYRDGLHSKTDVSNRIKVGTGEHEVISYVHSYSGRINAQVIDKIYLISPYGEEYKNIKTHYDSNWNATIRQKKYAHSTTEPQPKVTEIPATEQIKKNYPKARLYVLDFTGITDPQEKYDARVSGASVCNSKTAACTPLSTTDDYNGLYVTFDYSPDISDPTGYRDDIFWVKYSKGTLPVHYVPDAWYNCKTFDDQYHLLGDAKTDEKLSRMVGIELLPTEGLEVTSSAKQKNETDDWYRTYDGEENTILGLWSDASYKLTIANLSSLPVKGLSVYWPVPKQRQYWGDTLNPEGAFNYSMRLTNGLRNVPAGYEVAYAKNATPTGAYEQWDNYTWVSQKDTAGWSIQDWKEVNFVRMTFTGTKEVSTINYGNDTSVVFDLAVDSTSTSKDEMNQLDIWRPYFLRRYENSSSWIAGKPVAARLTPGHLSGRVWQDDNYDGKIDPNENFLSGVQVELYDLTDVAHPKLRVRATTDQDGRYVFDGLKDGTAENGVKDSCKIVVHNPKPASTANEPAEEEPFISFTKAGANMKMTASSDQKTASEEASPNQTGDGSNDGHDAGLIKSLPVTPPEVKKILNGDDEGEYAELPFNFSIKGVKGDEPISKEPKDLTASASVKKLIQPFKTLRFTKEGTYSYYIAEDAALPKAYKDVSERFSFDPSVYLFTVQVKRDEKGVWSSETTLRKKKNAVSGDDTAVNAVDTDKAIFTNTYTKPAKAGDSGNSGGHTAGTAAAGAPAPAITSQAGVTAVPAAPAEQTVAAGQARKPGATGDHSRIGFWLACMAASSAAIVMYIVVRKKRSR